MSNQLSQLRLARLQRGLVQTSLARMTGLSASRISMLERGLAIATPEEMKTLARVLTVSPETLFSEVRDGS